MGKIFKKKLMLATLFLVMSYIIASASTAIAYTINDTDTGSYWGGSVVNWSAMDVIGNPHFALDKMDITFEGALMTVSITGQYFWDGLHMYDHHYTPGDLYINSTGWTATGSSSDNYRNDTFTDKEGWNLVVTSTGVYNLDYNQIQYTNAYSGWGYRAGQAWRGGAASTTPITAVTYSLTNTGVSYTFDTTGLGLGPKFGLHWTMRCGNDVIEGLDPVPEPATMLLLGLGLVGIAGIRRKLST